MADYYMHGACMHWLIHRLIELALFYSVIDYFYYYYEVHENIFYILPTPTFRNIFYDQLVTSSSLSTDEEPIDCPWSRMNK